MQSVVRIFLFHTEYSEYSDCPSIDVSYASVFEPPEFVASFATTAGAVFEKASDTSLWVLRAKLRNSSSDSAHCMGKSVNSVDFV